MVLTKRQSQIIINQFNNLNLNQPVQMADPVLNYVLSPLERNTNPGYPQGFKICIQATKDIYK